MSPALANFLFETANFLLLAAALGWILFEPVRRALDTERERHAKEEEEQLQTSRNAQAAALADTVGRIAGESVARLLDALEGPSLDVALVRAACAELGGLPSSARGSALVESAHPLDAEARRLLGGALGDGFKERTVAELLAGVRVTTSAGQVDATALSLARHAAQTPRERSVPG